MRGWEGKVGRGKSDMKTRMNVEGFDGTWRHVFSTSRTMQHLCEAAAGGKSASNSYRHGRSRRSLDALRVHGVWPFIPLDKPAKLVILLKWLGVGKL